MRHLIRRTTAVLLGTLLGSVLALPSASAHSPTRVPLTAQVQDMAYQTQLIDCYYYRSGIRPKGSAHFQTYYRARCNPFDVQAKAMAKRGGPFARAYRDGLRTGWCFRWLGNSAIGTPVSTTCIATVERIFYAGNVR